MTPKKPGRSKAAASHLQPQAAMPSNQQSHRRQQSYSNNQIYASDSETPYLSDLPPTDSIPPPKRTNEELNLQVLCRHYPNITSILAIASYATVYNFTASTLTWDKYGCEGSLFVCACQPTLDGIEQYCVVVLNRRGLENFWIALTDEEDVKIEQLIVLRAKEEADTGEEQEKIYGLWIFDAEESTKDEKNVTFETIVECASHAGKSRRAAEERAQNGHGQYYQHLGMQLDGAHDAALDEPQPVLPGSNRISLQQLFGIQRAADADFSVKVHSPETQAAHLAGNRGHAEGFQQQYYPLQQAQQGRDLLSDLFRSAQRG